MPNLYMSSLRLSFLSPSNCGLTCYFWVGKLQLSHLWQEAEFLSVRPAKYQNQNITLKFSKLLIWDYRVRNINLTIVAFFNLIVELLKISHALPLSLLVWAVCVRAVESSYSRQNQGIGKQSLQNVESSTGYKVSN